MSMKPTIVYLIPEETEKVARAAFPKGNVYMKIYEELGHIYQDEQFRELFAEEGQPAKSPMRLALATIMQFAEGLSDRQAADAVRSRIDWKYLLCLKLTDPGFDHTVLSEFRSRLVSSQAETLLLDSLLKQVSELGLLKARKSQRTDSTHILGAIRALNRLERVGETLRATLNVLATVAPEWLRERSPAIWYERYSKRIDNYKFPKSDLAREQLASSVGEDGFLLLRLIEEEKEMLWLKEVPAVKILTQVWEQQYVKSPKVRFREAREFLPSAEQLVSPYDEDARWSTKQGFEWTGYKVHITETCQEDSPNLITQILTTPATTPDDKILNTVHEKLEEKNLLPSEHLVDKGYVDSEVLDKSQKAYQVKVIGPIAQDPSWQARLGAGFDKSHFVVDWERQIVTCPVGKESIRWKINQVPKLVGSVGIKFAKSDCEQCRFQPLCTHSKDGRAMTLLPQDLHLAISNQKQEQSTTSFKVKYSSRAGIEGTHSQAIRRCDMRNSRYIGLAKTHLQMVLTAVAINLVRLAEWFFLAPRAKTRLSPFAKLQTAFS